MHMNLKSLSKFTIYIFTMIVMVGLISCVPQSGKDKRNLASDNNQKDNSSPNTPNFDKNTNFIQYQQDTYSGLFSIANDFEDTFNIKGTNIHDYLSVSQNRFDVCLVNYFNNDSDSALIYAATVSSFYDYSKNEFFLEFKNAFIE
ncbi:MAG: hypothetical protein ACOCUT_03695, partial [bacterium]